MRQDRVCVCVQGGRLTCMPRASLMRSSSCCRTCMQTYIRTQTCHTNRRRESPIPTNSSEPASHQRGMESVSRRVYNGECVACVSSGCHVTSRHVPPLSYLSQLFAPAVLLTLLLLLLRTPSIMCIPQQVAALLPATNRGKHTVSQIVLWGSQREKERNKQNESR